MAANAMSLKFEVEGVDDLMKALEAFKRGAQNRILRPAVRAVAAIVSKAAKAKLKPGRGRETGILQKSIGVKMGVRRKDKAVYGVVGPRHKFRAPVGRKGGRGKLRAMSVTSALIHTTRTGSLLDLKWRDPTKYAHLVEYGRKPVSVKTKKVLSDGRTAWGVRVKMMPSRPFLRPAWDENKTRIMFRMRFLIQNGVSKEAQRVAKHQAKRDEWKKYMPPSRRAA